MFYEILQKYIEDKKGMKIWAFLDIDRTYWSKLKKSNNMKLEYYKKVCDFCGTPITDDHKKLSKIMIERYYE